jgi:hypothetical protein
MGSGWVSGHVAVDSYYRPRSLHDTTEIVLTHDAQNFEEFSAAIDELIAELEGVRAAGRRKFKKLKRE